MNREVILRFEKISAKDIFIAGGKGASLGEMTRAGFPVPPGFVVLASVFDKFLADTDLDPEIEAKMHEVNYKDINSVDRASNEIRELISDAEFPRDLGEKILKEYSKLGAKYVAVRSSATAEDSSVASWAGELESYLNVTKENLLESVKKCWSSLFTPRAIFYRFEKSLHKKPVSVAVVVQKMIQSEVSGICFTVHPVTKDKGQMVIEAGYGLGEAIVGGKITPDTYIIHKYTQGKPTTILDKNISRQETMIIRNTKGTKEVPVPKAKQGKQKLTDKQVLALADICMKIENHCKYPQDIEWGFENSQFYILQARPITTL
ncbi:MAG: Uncharacterized protein Greene071421_52 [Parcubacteria group bacterium Greene0714_21]|nr:MAG: Uncharacterized protein Greene041639_450 [Parcubacteria group bacterium Greene0416_39]TSC97840.1 MAG: Uncharacterized protein Greene101447_291 [Parcubacteria group bacterium Greene1014_47]TSD04566.1 MAG: Uncharacterized protein Greene071421_52 [Parcubacteria group bacterium Greene0714_21]